mgnify:CR=1 FL=1
MRKIEILGIVGSHRKDSYNRSVLKAAQDLTPDGAVLNLIEIHGIPIFNPKNVMSPPDTVLEFKRRILAADALLFATPEYDYSLPIGLKNAINWASAPNGNSVWKNKPAAVLGAPVDSLRMDPAQDQLRQILTALNMPVLNQPALMHGKAAHWFDHAGKLTDEPTRQFVQKLMSALLLLIPVFPANKIPDNPRPIDQRNQHDASRKYVPQGYAAQINSPGL